MNLRRHSLDLRLHEVDSDPSAADGSWTWIEVKWTPQRGWMGAADVVKEIARLQSIARGDFEREQGETGARKRYPLERPVKVAFFSFAWF